MNLSDEIISHIKRLGGTIKEEVKVDTSDFTYVNLAEYPDCYSELLFNIEWPDIEFCMYNKSEMHIKPEDIDFSDYEEVVEIMRFIQIQIWGYKDAEFISTSDSYVDMADHFLDKYIIIGNVRGKYALFLNLTEPVSDGDPVIDIVYAYEPAGENVYYSGKLSEFLSRLIEYRDEEE